MSQPTQRFEPLALGRDSGDVDLFPITDVNGTWGPWDAQDPLVAANENGDAEAKLLGELSRRAPSATMQKPYQKLLDWARKPYADPAAATPRNNVLYVQGEPGTGKTELPFVVAHALGYKHEFIPYGVSGGDVDNLVIEKEFNGEAVSDIFEKIEMNLRSAKPSKLLLQGLGAKGWLDEDMKSLAMNPAKGDFDQDLDALQKLATSAGLLKASSGLVNVKTRNGRLLKTLIEARDESAQAKKEGRLPKPVLITIDEFNRNKLFGARLQNFWEVASGKRDRCEIEGRDDLGNPVTYTFTRDDLAHVFLYMTGNDPEKVADAREIPPDLKSRIGLESIPNFTVEDWQVRLEHKLCGMPIDPHYRASQSYWDSEEAVQNNGFGNFLDLRRTQGMDAESAANVSAREKLMLAHWDAVHGACNKLGKFMERWSELTRSRQGPLAAALRENGNSRSRLIGPRILDDLIGEAFSQAPKPSTRDKNRDVHRRGNYGRAPVGPEEIGTRLVAAITSRIDADFPKTGSEAQQNARKVLYAELVECGVIGREEYLAEFEIDENEQPPTTPAGKTAKDLLNIREIHKHQHLGEVQQVLCDILREQHPDQYAGVDNDRLISRTALDAALEVLDEERRKRPEQPASNLPNFIQPIALPTLNPSATGLSLVTHGGCLVDAHHLPQQSSDALNRKLDANMNPDAILSTTEFLSGFALGDEAEQVKSVYPRLNFVMHGKQLANAIANRGNGRSDIDQEAFDATVKSLRDNTSHMPPQPVSYPYLGDKGEHAFNFLSDTHHSELGCSVVQTRMQNEQGEWQDDCLTVISVRVPTGDDLAPETRMLITGHAAISPQLQKLLKEKHIDYVSAGDEDAPQKALVALKNLAADASMNATNAGIPGVGEEGSHNGFLYQLQVALNHRIPAGYDASIENDEANGSALAERRAVGIVAQMLSPNNLGNHITQPLYATRITSETLGGQSRSRA